MGDGSIYHMPGMSTTAMINVSESLQSLGLTFYVSCLAMIFWTMAFGKSGSAARVMWSGTNTAPGQIWTPKGNYQPWFKIGENGGQWDIERQDAGLSEIDFRGKTVLEVGCAEGLVALQNLKRGARISHGIEYRERAVEVCKSIAGVLGLSDVAKFYWGDVGEENALNQPGMLDEYDIVLAMAVLQKTSNQPEVFARMLKKCKSTLVLRLPFRKLYRYRLPAWRKSWNNSWGAVDPVEVARKNGFKLVRESSGYPQVGKSVPKTDGSWFGVFERQ